MELVRLKITGTVVTSQYGALSDGDILVTSQAFAKHLIDEHRVAEYITDVAQPQIDPVSDDGAPPPQEDAADAEVPMLETADVAHEGRAIFEPLPEVVPESKTLVSAEKVSRRKHQ